MGLYCLSALRGLWGFCTREVFGGFGACCVFAFVLSFCICVCLSFCPFLCLSAVVVLCLSLLSLWVVLGFLFGLLFPFPLRTIRQKERARRLVRPLLSCCGLVYMFSVSLSAASFAFENIHPAPQVR